jgi:outer membrane receptor protein involved in Fe transport
MRMIVPGLLACSLVFVIGLSTCLSAAEIKGTVVDPSGSPISGAQVSLVSRLGVEAKASAGPDGAFRLEAPRNSESRLVVTAPGFATSTVPPTDGVVVQLEIAPVVDSVSVAGSAMDVPAAEQGGSVSIIPNEEIRERNEPLAIDLLRYVPGLEFSQTGATGGLAGLFIRGGNANFNLVQLDGVPVNTFGGDFDFAHIPAEALDHVEVVRGPQSAIYGPYAISGAIDYVTREPQSTPNLDVVAEGGSYDERRFGISAGGKLAGFGLTASASRLDTNGPVANSDYRNENLALGVTRRFGRQSLTFHGYFDSNANGVPGPWGSDPQHDFTGIDTVSRNSNNFSGYVAHYQGDLTDRVRQEVFGTFFLNNNAFVSPYGFTSNKDLRGQAESRTVVSVTRHYVMAFGASEGLEEVRNSYIYDAAMDTFPIRRNDTAIYLENRFEFGGRLFINVGVRGEWLRTGAIPTDGYSRPFFPTQTVGAANPKVAASYNLGGMRWHASIGTGIRPPNGFELAYTNNPALKPERTAGVDAGVERKLWHDRLSLDGTYFYNRFYDLIVILGGSLSTLSHYQSDNLANSRAQGAEFSAGLRPARWVFVTGSYTYLKSEILSLNGTSATAPTPFSVGQQLLRRPANSGEAVATFTRGKLAANLTGYFRGSVLDVEPTYGASAGLYRNPGFANVGVNLNYALAHGVTAYGNLRNALDQHYEEVFGYPSPRLNFVAGLKWGFGKL